MTQHRAAATTLVLASAILSTGHVHGNDGPRGLPSCPNILSDFIGCHPADTDLPALLSSAQPGAFRVAEDVRPTTSNPTRLCWLGRYQDRQNPAVADESFRVRIFNNDQGIPDVAAGPIFVRTFSQSGNAGVDLLELSCLDGQNCPGTPDPATGGHFVYSVEIAEGLPMSAMECYYVEITCLGSAAAGRTWAWSGSAGGSDFRSFQATDGQYTFFTMVDHDRAVCVSGGLSPFVAMCGPTIPPPICANEDANGQRYDGTSPVLGLLSSSVGSVGNPQPPGAWSPLQRAENFQVASPMAVTNICFQGFYLAFNCGANTLPPEPTHDIEFYADVAGVPGGPAPIASFRLGTTPGVTYVWDGDSLVSATHPPVALEPGRCYWLAISREQSASPDCHLLWHWQLTTSPSPAADRVLASRDVSGATPGPWQPETVTHEGDTSISNLVYLLDAGPVAAPICGDCDTNGTADAQEIAADPTLDCFTRSASFGRGGPDGLLDACQCVADWNRDGAVNSTDISGYLTTWIIDHHGQNLPADITCDGMTNSTDISRFIAIWIASIQGETPLDRCQ